jgi:hypothetical protein
MNKILKFWARFFLVRLSFDNGDPNAGGGGSLLAGGDKGGGASGGTPDWRSSLPEDIRNEAVFASVKAKDAGEALGIIGKSYVHAQRMVGAEKILRPRDNWTPEQWREWNKSVGVPETHDKYTIPEVKLAEGLTLVPEKMENFKKVFHDAGLRPDQVQKVMKAYLEDVNGEFTGKQTAASTARAQAEQELKTEYGDKYDAKLDVARSVLKKFGSDTLLQKLESSGLANDPEVVRMFAKLGEGMLEDRAGGSGDGLILQTSTQALQEINALKGDKEFQSALSNRTNPGHKAAVDKWYQLHQQAAASKS